MQLDLLEVLERLDRDARGLLADLHELDAKPCAATHLESQERVARDLGGGARLILRVDETVGRWLDPNEADGWIGRLAELAAVPGFAGSADGASAESRGESWGSEEACLAGRLDYRVGRAGEHAGRAALELWLGGPSR